MYHDFSHVFTFQVTSNFKEFWFVHWAVCSYCDCLVLVLLIALLFIIYLFSALQFQAILESFRSVFQSEPECQIFKNDSFYSLNVTSQDFITSGRSKKTAEQSIWWTRNIRRQQCVNRWYEETTTANYQRYIFYIIILYYYYYYAWHHSKLPITVRFTRTI